IVLISHAESIIGSNFCACFAIELRRSADENEIRRRGSKSTQLRPLSSSPAF
ncbi:unnamed protein product, partial [Rotaria socialis]